MPANADISLLFVLKITISKYFASIFKIISVIYNNEPIFLAQISFLFQEFEKLMGGCAPSTPLIWKEITIKSA